MVEPDDVDQPQEIAEALDPPGVSGARQRIPAVVWIAPELAGGAEIVGRHPRHHQGRAVLVELEELLMGPDIGAVVGDEDRNVADDPYAKAVDIRLDCRPLGGEDPLDKAV